MTTPIHLDGGPVRTPAQEAGVYWVRFTADAVPTEVKDDANIVAITNTGTGVYRVTFTDAQTQVLGILGEPVLIAPTDWEDVARVTDLSVGTSTAGAYVEITTYDDSGGAAADLGLDVMVGFWIQRAENEV